MPVISLFLAPETALITYRSKLRASKYDGHGRASFEWDQDVDAFGASVFAAGDKVMDQLPVFFNLTNRWVAVLGGGVAAARKAELALRAGARVRAFAEKFCEEFDELTPKTNLTRVPHEPRTEDLDDCALLYCAAEDNEQNRRARSVAQAAHIPCNVVDVPELCDFTMPSIVDRSPVVIAISTAGSSPILGRMIKARLETLLPAAYGRVAAFVGRYRKKVVSKLKDFDGRRRFWERILEGPVVDLVLAGHDGEAIAEFDAQLEAAARGAKHCQQGEVYLVGAGPGDPDLLTFKALRLMQRADVVLYDRLVGEGILNLVRRDAERIYVGKLPREHTVPQDEISRMLLRLAKEGKRVLRLKGGDPFVFGRGGEEIELLAEAGIPFQVVPGITAASGCAAYAGIPLTHRDHAQACVFVTGHSKDGRPDFEWKVLLQPRQTVAVYMGLAHLAEIARAFIESGAAPSMPVALIDNGTRPNQQVLTATLATVAEKAATIDVKGPAILIIGSVVRLREKLDWYVPEEQPSVATPATAPAAE
jgi:uroporphyrin-III C-methyltransferase/precorrin-2 dehydrogenase/sirohydrochlorin ferrochelatase